MSEEIKKYLYAFSIVPIFGGFLALSFQAPQIIKVHEAIIYGALCQIGLFILAFGKKVWDRIEPTLVDLFASSTISGVNKWSAVLFSVVVITKLF